MEHTHTSIMPRACHNCRLRKIRCNRQLPCSNCQTSNLACRSASKSAAVRVSPTPTSTPTEPPGSEKNVDRLHERICALENAMQELVRRSNYESPESHSVSTDGEPRPHESRLVATTTFEGVPSFRRQAFQASQISHLTAPDINASPPVMQGLAALQGILERPDTSARSDGANSSALRDNLSPRMKLPPSDFVIRVLRMVDDSRCRLFLFHAVQGREQVEQLCKSVYFPVETPSIGVLTLFHGMLQVILSDLINQEATGTDSEDLKRLYDLCQANFQSGIETYELVAIPSYENALALAIAMTNAQIEGKLAHHANLTSIVARHCLNLGYHREETVARMPGWKADSVRRLFWQVYIFDKNLSLRLGRAPSIQDYDVDLKQQGFSQDPRGRAWGAATSAIIDFSSHQAGIYELLYSPSSNKLADNDRKDTVNRLVQDLDMWYQGWQRIDASQAKNREFFETTFGPIEVAYFSIVTLVFRGATSSSSALDISPACYDAAQKGLQAHLNYWSRSVANNSKTALSFYAIWILLYSSFTPYIIIFLHCIATLAPSDLQLLKNVHETLEDARSTSEAINRYYEICQTLYRIAEAFIEHRVSLAEQASDFPFGNPAFFVQRLEADLWAGSFSNFSFADLGNLPFSLED